MPAVPLAPQHWACPNCDLEQVAQGAKPGTLFHNCAGLKGLTAPMVPAGTVCKVETRVREDYIGGELVTVDGDGRPVMSVETTRDDGNDLAVFAPTALSGGQA
jgi:hypothetical protein